MYIIACTSKRSGNDVVLQHELLFRKKIQYISNNNNVNNVSIS
ncbi:MAG: hypothetical protein ACI8RD_010523 [Bacillariaceae sp.]|jgi:hypothetical protein